MQLTQQPRSFQPPSRAREPLPGAEQPTVPAALARLGPERQSLRGTLTGPHRWPPLPEGKGKATRGHSIPTRDSNALLRWRSGSSKLPLVGEQLNATQQILGKPIRSLRNSTSEKFNGLGRKCSILIQGGVSPSGGKRGNLSYRMEVPSSLQCGHPSFFSFTTGGTN